MLAGPPRRFTHASSRAVVRYAVGWLGAGAIVAAAFLLARPSAPAELPPVRHSQLERAARSAGCQLRRGSATERLNPPAAGASAGSVTPGVYAKPLPAAAVIGALRRGVVVIQYRRSLSRDAVAQLAAVQSSVPRGTILVPNATAMPFDVAVLAWQHLLGCRRFGTTAYDAVRLFRGRFIGSGPGS
jgi:hypothetical protein